MQQDLIDEARALARCHDISPPDGPWTIRVRLVLRALADEVEELTKTREITPAPDLQTTDTSSNGV